MGYYDIHTHILPGVDDGSQNLEETEKMLQLEYNEGVRYIIATPHYSVGGKNPSIKELQDALQKTRKIAEHVGNGDMIIQLGNELLYGLGLIEALKKGLAKTMAGTRYILLEYYPQEEYQTIYHSCQEFIRNGYIPIIAHVERYYALEKKHDCLLELRKLGACLQMNTESLYGGLFDRKAARCRKLVDKGVIQFLGSDCHHCNKRVPLMKSSFRNLKENFSETEIGKWMLYKNPMKLMHDQYID